MIIIVSYTIGLRFCVPFKRQTYAVYSNYEFANTKSTAPPNLSQSANKTYSDLALENMRLKLYQELGF